MPEPFPIGEVSFKSYLPSKKIFLSQTNQWDFIQALHVRYPPLPSPQSMIGRYQGGWGHCQRLSYPQLVFKLPQKVICRSSLSLSVHKNIKTTLTTALTIWLIPSVGKMKRILWCDWLPEGRDFLHCVCNKKFFWPRNNSFIDQTSLGEMAGYLPHSFFAFLFTGLVQS